MTAVHAGGFRNRLRAAGYRWRRPVGFTALLLTVCTAGFLVRPIAVGESTSAATVLTPVELGFSQDMFVHHEQALIMVQRLDSGVNPTVRQLAQQIGDAQRMEIGTLLGWLRLANAAPESRHPMAWMNNAAGHDHSMPTRTGTNGTAMPGMATQAERDSLATARGTDAEVLFLQLMLRHHRGGVAMAKAADQLLTSGPVKESARGMITAQSQEAGLMTIMLAQRGAQPL
ncbi:hypothetical protein NSK11_contig00007-0112 [Nocardia seriolae]|uniref:DUF305 domain-containing protein n=1 Tax=Nocardia seriolae TaxID=37332 RepID=A0ABC9YN43_9NOCA|nr:DUF305 domain-containing protein [Nocardia seriolae]BEK96403.1 DUF305 domain-containing protein [Nocardia seriolae]GAM44609.1 hypothetical protein NS07_v2contig00005-0112 [Nocardia seriolae]GAP26628.1 hypothetical protein NSK11_contig00007-0112 [Nocardia seriolae]